MIEGNLKALVLLEARDLLFACNISTKHDKCHHQDPKLFSSQVRDIFFEKVRNLCSLGRSHNMWRATLYHLLVRQWHPTPVLLPGKSHGWRSLVGCSPWGREESDTTEWLPFHFSLSCTGEGNGNPLQCSCLENPRDGGAWWAAIYGITQSQTRLKQLSSSSNKTQLNTPNISFKLLVLSFSLSINFLCSLIIIYLYIYS